MSTFIERICRVCSDALGDHANSVAKFAAGAPSYPRSAYISLMRTNAAVVMVLTALRSSVSLRYSSPTRLRLVSRMWRRATMSSPVVTAATLPAKLQIARETGSTSVDCGALEYLASKVVQGTADKVVLSNSRLKRRRCWDLFLGTPNCGSEAAILVVNKKSSFTLEDARLAVAVMHDEINARCPQVPIDTKHGRTGSNSNVVNCQLLLATRSQVTPAADVFIRGLPKNSSGRDTTAIIRWERLANLVEDGAVGSLFSSSQVDGKHGFRRAGAISLPTWLLEEREKQRHNRSERLFDLESPFLPSGDQPEAIDALTRGLSEGKRHQTLLGATGTGKTFIVANVIQRASRPTLVLAPNKVLAAQLTNELRALFPRNAVEYFVSYYDYFMPEAFNSASDTYIDKVVLVNDDIDRMRHSATRSLLERRDVIVVASVSCIYGLGMPSKYLEASIRICVGQEWVGGWRVLARHLEQNLYYAPQRSSVEFAEFDISPRGKFRVIPHGRNGAVVEVGPAADEAVISVHFDAKGVVTRVQFCPTGDNAGIGVKKEKLRGVSAVVAAGGIDIDGFIGDSDTVSITEYVVAAQDEKGIETEVEAYVIYPAKHHVVGGGEMEAVLQKIAGEMEERCADLAKKGMILEAERLRQRTENDMLLLRAVGTCKGIENYSRHLAGRDAGDPPETLIDYFPEDDWLLVVDESHVSAPQLGAMHAGNLARKIKLVDHGFRLPSALDNRPLMATEFWSKISRNIFLSATPGKFELELSNPTMTSMLQASSGKPAGGASGLGWDEIGNLVDAQAVIRPTGIPDPLVDIRPSEGQVADLVQECRVRRDRGERVLVTVLTKRMAEDLCAFLVEQSVLTAYLHCDVKPMQRLELLRQLRSGEVAVIVGVNLLREGLNLPEVSLVCILDADAEGFLRSDTALLQTIGRATRHQAGRAVLYADRITPSMKRALAETDRRRDIQLKHNELHGITPSVAMAASVGDSLLNSISTAGESARGRHRQSVGKVGDELDGVASWADPALPPDQVQLLYDLAAQRGKDTSRSPPRAPVQSSSGNSSTSGNNTGSSVGVDHGFPALKPSEDTLCALKRLSEQAAERMAQAASKTDFKEAALWRNRRDALLSTMHHIEGGIDVAGEEVVFAIG